MTQFDKKFRSHLFIEYYFRQEQKFLLEHFHSDNNKLFESYGLFENIDEIIDQIYYDILLKDKTEIIIDNDWIYKISVLYIEDKDLLLRAGYLYKKSILKNGKFNPLALTFLINKLYLSTPFSRVDSCLSPEFFVIDGNKE